MTEAEVGKESKLMAIWRSVSLSDKIQIFMAAILLATGLVSAISSISALSLTRKQIAESNEFAANASWERFVEVAIENSEMAAGISNDQLAKMNVAQQAAYQWFLERMLFAGEQILYATDDDKQWHLSIKLESARHLPLLASEYFSRDDFCTYRAELRGVLVELDKENPNANLKFESIKCDASYD